MTIINFELLVDNIPYSVHAEPFIFNNQKRFRVRYNDSPEFIFAWDETVDQLIAIDEDASQIPDTVESAIAEKLMKPVYNKSGAAI
jgi:hypothetical protein